MQYENEKIELSKEEWSILKEAKARLRPGSLVLHYKKNGELGKYELHIYPQREKKRPFDK